MDDKEIRNMDFQTSMRLILGENPQEERVDKPKYQPFTPTEHKESAEKHFKLPETSDKINHVYAYLTKTRGIPEYIVNDCINNGLIMEDSRRNAVFVGYDDKNLPKYAARRGTFTPDGKEPFNREIFMEWGKAAQWNFENGNCTAHSEKSSDDVVMAFKVFKDKEAEIQQTTEVQSIFPDVSDIA